MFLLVSVRHVGAHPGEHQHGVSIQISICLGKKFLRISRIRKNSSDLNLGEGLCICTSFHFPDSGLYVLNGFDFYFDRSTLNGVTLKTSNCEHKWIQVYSYINLKLSLFAFFRKCWMINTSWWGKRIKMLTLFLNDLKAKKFDKINPKKWWMCTTAVKMFLMWRFLKILN